MPRMKKSSSCPRSKSSFQITSSSVLSLVSPLSPCSLIKTLESVPAIGHWSVSSPYNDFVLKRHKCMSKQSHLILVYTNICVKSIKEKLCIFIFVFIWKSGFKILNKKKVFKNKVCLLLILTTFKLKQYFMCLIKPYYS